MNNECIIELLKYQVEKIHFDINPTFDFQNNTSIEIAPSLSRDIAKIDDETAKVTLAFHINNNEKLITPFDVEIIISGTFKLNDWENENVDIMKINTVAILFPFLRALVATVTSNANVPPYVIPVFNVEAWLDESEKKEQEN